MTLQNRVTPDGEIVVAPWRGALMGNRGCLHDEENRLGKARWRHRNWVCCVTEFRGRHRHPMPPPGSPTVYTALFFWDEATAFSAGHRPCGECRNAEYRRFKSLWSQAGLGDNSAKEMDRTLHAARLDLLKHQRPKQIDDLSELPDGTIIRISDTAHSDLGLSARTGVLLNNCFYRWKDEGGYGAAEPRPVGSAEVLTPAPILRLFQLGYLPFIRLEPEQRFTIQPD